MGGHKPRTADPHFDREAWERRWDARIINLQSLKTAGIPEDQAGRMLDRIEYGSPEFEPRTTRRERYWGRSYWGRNQSRDYDKVSGRKNERRYFLMRCENYQRAVVELRLAQLRPQRIRARAVHRANRNMRREFLYAEHDVEPVT